MKKFFLVLLCFSVCPLFAALQTPTAELASGTGKLLLKNRMTEPEWKQTELAFSVTNGIKKTPVPLKWSLREEKDSLLCTGKNDALSITSRFTAEKRLFLCTMTLTNTGKKQLRLEVGLNAALGAWKPLQFWNGSNKMENVGSAPIVRNGFKGRALKHIGTNSEAFCAVAAAGKNSSLLLGNRPFDPVSYSGAALDPGKGIFSYFQRPVLDPGETVELRWVTGVSGTAFGIPEGVVQSYYDSFPQDWHVIGGQENPYVWGIQGHYLNWWSEPDPERSRRWHVTMDWAYCPYKRAGMIDAGDDTWEYKQLNPFRNLVTMGGVKLNLGKMTAPEFRKLRKERFLKYGRRYGWMFYNNAAGHLCEYNLAYEKYRDAIDNYDKSGTVVWTSWSTHHDKEIRMFPYGTEFGELSIRHMTQMAKELDLPGFAFDCGTGGLSHRGPVVKKQLKGRSWDEKGLFIDRGVSIMDVVDKVHAMPGKTPLVCWVNGTLKGDFMMLERSYVDRTEFFSMVPLYRWWIGPRPGSVHKHGYLFSNVVPNWRKLDQKQFCVVMGKLADYVILNQFMYGLNNTRSVMYGTPQTSYILPEALELVRAGWQATVPMETGKLYAPYRARYGSGANTFLFLANSSEKDSSGTVKVCNRELAQGRGDVMLFVRKMRQHGASVNRLAGGVTSLDITLPARTPVLWETVCAFAAPPAELVAAVSSEKDLNRECYTVEFQQTKAFSSPVAFRTIRNFALEKVLLNGKAVPFRKEGTLYRTENVSFVPGAKLELVYRSNLFALTQKEVSEFPFVNRDKVSFRVFAEGEAKPVADRFNEYFTYCAKNGLVKNFSKVVSASAPGKGVITLQLAPGKAARIAKDPSGGLLVTAPDAEKLDQAVTSLFYSMDARFPVAVPFGKNALIMGITGAQIRHFKAEKLALPVRPYFDGDAK